MFANDTRAKGFNWLNIENPAFVLSSTVCRRLMTALVSFPNTLNKE